MAMQAAENQDIMETWLSVRGIENTMDIAVMISVKSRVHSE